MAFRNENETKLFHYIFTGMGLCLLSLIAWIGINVAHIPVIDQQITDLKAIIENVLTKQINDHEMRIRNLERK